MEEISEKEKERRRKISVAKMGIGNAQYGKPRTPEQKVHQSQVIKGKRIGWTHTEESRKKMSDRTRGVLHPYYGKKRTQETKDKIRSSHKGIIPEDNTKLKIVESKIGGIWYGNVRYCSDIQYCEKFNNDFKERVRAYFGFRCFYCGAIQTNKKHSVHHVHYDKKMCCNGSPRDVVPLCSSCHSETNGNRDWWERMFTELLYLNNPSGKCYFTKNEYNILNTYTYSNYYGNQQVTLPEMWALLVSHE